MFLSLRALLTSQSLYSMHGIDNIAAWTFAGAAVRIATSIALYRDNDLPWTPDREVPRRVWWSLYDLERFLCANLALPSSINDELVNTSLPSDYSVCSISTYLTIAYKRDFYPDFTLSRRLICPFPNHRPNICLPHPSQSDSSHPMPLPR